MTTYTLKGFIWDYKDFQRNGTTILAGDRRVTVLAYGMTVVPKVGDRIEAKGVEYAIVTSDRDPADATYTMQVRA